MQPEQIATIQTFITNIAIVGILCSLAIEALTRLLSSKPLLSKFVSVIFCMVVATGYYFASQAPWWPTFIGILGMASLVYAIFFNSNKSSSTDTINQPIPPNLQG